MAGKKFTEKKIILGCITKMTQLRLEKITKIYPGNIKAIDDITLDIPAGSTMVIAGPSGSGKTTLLRLIAGLEKPTAGSIYFNDELANDIEPKDRDVAMVFQNYPLYPHMTVFENMAFALKMQKKSKNIIKEKVFDAAKLLGIIDVLKRKPFQLSGGQRQRVALGKAIVREPKVFLFDEPLSNLDFMLRRNARTELKQILNKLKTTAVYVTHDQTEAIYLGDSICIINHGQIEQTGTAEKIKKTPASLFVKEFMNIETQIDQ